MFLCYYSLEAFDGSGFDRESEETDELVKKYGIFDLKSSRSNLLRNRCRRDNPCPRLICLYAKMGLHRYNLLQGTKFKLKCMRKYIETLGCASRSYYMTLDAIDTAAAAAAGSSSVQTFQIKISEEARGQFSLLCDIARIRGESKSDKETMIVDASMPEWPPENPFERHCLGNEEVKSNDWIRLYVELALATTQDRDGDVKFSLKIVNVATDLLDGELNARNATFYIRYLDKSKGEESDCVAIVRRKFDEETGCFILVGRTHPTSDILSKKRKMFGDVSVDKRIKTGLSDHFSSDLATTREEDHEAANQEAMSSYLSGFPMK